MSDASSKPHRDEPKEAEKQAYVVPWGPAAAILVTILAFLGAQIVSAILIVGLLGGFNWYSESWLNSVEGQFVFVALSDTLIVLAIWRFLRRRKASFRLIGFMRLPVWSDLGRALLAYLSYFGILLVTLILAQTFTHIDVDQKQELGFEKLAGSWEILMAFLSLVIFAPIVEEIVFRGFLFTGLRRKLTFVGATAITSVLFAAPHLLASSQGPLWVAGIDTLILSFILCYLREKTGALWASIAVHLFKNSVAFILLLASLASI